MGDRPQALPRREEELLDMPPGFRFHPTDLEIVVNYLEEKVVDRHFTAVAIGEADLNSIEPWDLPNIAKLGEKEWYFFWQRDRKYPTGSRTNRATESGYWKATGKDKEIYRGKGYLVGMKKTLVFYLGRAPRGKKTSWVMHEYRLEGRSLLHLARAAARNDWVVCRVFHKNEQPARRSPAYDGGVEAWPSPTALPPLLDSPCPDTAGMMPAPYAVPYPHEPLLFHLHQPAEYMEPLQLHQECKIEDYPLHPLAGTGAGPCEFTLNLDAGGGASFDGPGSPSSSAGPLGDLDNIWSY